MGATCCTEVSSLPGDAPKRRSYCVYDAYWREAGVGAPTSDVILGEVHDVSQSKLGRAARNGAGTGSRETFICLTVPWVSALAEQFCGSCRWRVNL